MRHYLPSIGALMIFITFHWTAWQVFAQDDPTPDPVRTTEQRTDRAKGESALARLLFDPHVEMLLQWGGGGGGALREITNDLPPGTDGFRFTERPVKPPGVFWFALRLEPAGEPTAGWTRVFMLDEKERQHIEGLCYCPTCSPGTDAEINYEPMINYLERKVSELAEAWFNDAVKKYAVECAENERRRPTEEPAVSDIADALLHGKTRLYRIPHENFDLKTLRRTLLVW